MTDQPLPVPADNLSSEDQPLLIGDTRLRRVIGGLFALALVIGSLVLVMHWRATAWDFRNNLWGPAHLLVSGQNPYLLDSLFEVGNPIWMPTVIGALFPLGWLSEHAAAALWFLASVGALLMIYRLSTQRVRKSLGRMTVMLIGGFCFMPTVSHLVLGQFGLFAALLMLLAAHCAMRERWVLAGMLVALATAKPQLILLPTLGLAIYAWQQGSLTTLIRFGLSSAVMAALLTLPLWIAAPDWLAGLQIAFTRNYAWAQPSSLVTFRLVLGSTPGFVLWQVLLVTAIGVTVWLWRRIDPLPAVAWSLMLNLLVSPYAWSWDFVLVLPLWFHLTATTPSRRSRAVLLLGYALTWVGTVAIRLNTDGDEIRFWWFPWAWLAVFLLASIIAQHDHQKRPVSELT